jgi:GSH-dependent disulfide-bond oxidoreductase
MTDSPTCTPLTVWKWNKENGADREQSHDRRTNPRQRAAVGRQSLQLYSLASPNGVKVTVMRGWGSNTTTGG